MRGPIETTHPSTPAAENAARSRRGAYSATRIMAILVLFPAVPTFLGSVLALAMFYMAPERFNAWIARLPGEAAIRMVLIFAPVVMFAVVVLAFLYAITDSGPDEGTASLAAGSDSTGTERAFLVEQVAQRVLIVSLPAFLLAIFVRVIAFLAPTRFAGLIDPLPGTRLLAWLVDAAPFLMLFVVLLCLGLTLGLRARRAGRDQIAASLGISPNAHALRLAVLSVLLSSVPIFGMSVIALGAYTLRPARFEAFLLRMSPGTVLRLGMLFVPASLFLIVGLGLLYLLSQPGWGKRPGSAGMPKLQAGLTWFLVAGMLLAGTTVLGLFGAGLLFLLR